MSEQPRADHGRDGKAAQKRPETHVSGARLRKELRLVIAQENDHPASRLRRLLLQLVDEQDRARAVLSTIDQITDDQEQLPALRLQQDPVHRHKDVLRHTFVVVENVEPDQVLRLAALLHDIGKPSTRQITSEGVQFHHHEMVGARLAEVRLRALRYPNDVVADVVKLVEIDVAAACADPAVSASSAKAHSSSAATRPPSRANRSPAQATDGRVHPRIPTRAGSGGGRRFVLRAGSPGGF